MQWLKKIIKAGRQSVLVVPTIPSSGKVYRFQLSRHHYTPRLIRPPISLVVPEINISFRRSLVIFFSSLRRYSRLFSPSIRPPIQREREDRSWNPTFPSNSAKSICLMRKSAVHCHGELALRLQNHKWSTSAQKLSKCRSSWYRNCWKLSRILTRSRSGSPLRAILAFVLSKRFGSD